MNDKLQMLLKRIQSDDKFYIENFLKIKDKNGKLIKFKYNAMQEKSERLIREKQTSKGKPVRVIWLKARQHGISTYAEGKIFKNTSTQPFRNSLIIAHEDKATQNLFSMSKLFFEELPSVIRPMKKYSNETALTFENPTNDDNEKNKNPGLRSKFSVATAKNVNTGRSATYHNLHASEVAFWDNADTLMTGLLQCVPDTPNSMVFIESTANGVGGWFYDFWWKSVRGETEYLPIFLAWFENPDYSREFESEIDKENFIKDVDRITIDNDGKEVRTEEYILKETFDLTYEQLNWRKWCINNKLNGDLEKFHQEYPSTPEEAFIASGRPKFNIPSLKGYQKQLKPPIASGYLKDTGEFVEDTKGYIRIWKKPERDKFYTLGADVAEGLAHGDYSCAIILDEDFNVCASWHGHIDADLFGDECVKLAKLYNEAYMGMENNNHGGTAIKAILRKEYWNLYYEKSYNKIQEKISQKVGWNTNKRTKPLMINTLAEYIRNQWLGIWWDTLVSELFTYTIKDDGTFGAQAGCHDDSVMAMAIALMLMLENRGEDFEPEIPHEEKTYNDFHDEYGNEEIGYDHEEVEIAN